MRRRRLSLLGIPQRDIWQWRGPPSTLRDVSSRFQSKGSLHRDELGGEARERQRGR